MPRIEASHIIAGPRALSPVSRAVPPPLPGQSRLPPPLPGERPGEFDPRADVHSGRDQLHLGRGQKFGVWIATNSTNVNRIKCDQDVDAQGNRLPTGTVYIEFLNLSLYQYSGVPLNNFLDLESSSSKGRYVYYVVRESWPAGVQLRGPMRSAAETARLAALREPHGTDRQGQPRANRYYNVGGGNRNRGGTPSRPR